MIPIYYFLFNNLYFACFIFDFSKFVAASILIFAVSHIFIRELLGLRTRGRYPTDCAPSKRETNLVLSRNSF